eukprot:362080-Chlamydomonas_euryale.AAC.1
MQTQAGASSAAAPRSWQASMATAPAQAAAAAAVPPAIPAAAAACAATMVAHTSAAAFCTASADAHAPCCCTPATRAAATSDSAEGPATVAVVPKRDLLAHWGIDDCPDGEAPLSRPGRVQLVLWHNRSRPALGRRQLRLLPLLLELLQVLCSTAIRLFGQAPPSVLFRASLQAYTSDGCNTNCLHCPSPPTTRRTDATPTAHPRLPHVGRMQHPLPLPAYHTSDGCNTHCPSPPTT